MGWVISQANKWEDYSNHLGEGTRISRNGATTHFLAFYCQSWNRHSSCGCATQHMLIHCNEYIMRLKVSWKLNLPAPWASVVLISLCHILRTTSFFQKLYAAQLSPVLIPALVRTCPFLDLSSNAKGVTLSSGRRESSAPPKEAYFQPLQSSPCRSFLSCGWESCIVLQVQGLVGLEGSSIMYGGVYQGGVGDERRPSVCAYNWQISV